MDAAPTAYRDHEVSQKRWAARRHSPSQAVRKVHHLNATATVGPQKTVATTIMTDPKRPTASVNAVRMRQARVECRTREIAPTTELAQGIADEEWFHTMPHKRANQVRSQTNGSTPEQMELEFD